MSLARHVLSVQLQDRHVDVVYHRHTHDGSVRTPALAQHAKQPFDQPKLRSDGLRGDPFSRNERVSNWRVKALNHTTRFTLDSATTGRTPDAC